ncbi:aarF domain-containing kinase 1 [Macrosteles quadrilineatus]|uniref:aarF domain-containing kinase 1 n=1 Tax=Macrosteles quadrilineatus TaxID=74068 RepID=UPI0023E2481A|nr:aarF domain-containing kinase 1 [Macrosteles quadrilineatus]XP_054272475.1 aarF domain-containing kinase 1 [Macrosteles quadrilineatus]XP_054272476.1 aarF domain-containing kinase 1 [Macrosteles quadrilineatus]
MWPLRRVLKYGFTGGVLIGGVTSLHANQYDVNSIGVVRLGRSAITVFKIGLKYKLDLYNSSLDPESEEYALQRSKVHKEAAEELLDLCRANKGVYIKVGQHIGALDYLVPPEYVTTMKVLHSHAPTSPLSEVYRVIREDLKVNPEELFESIDPEPLGAASLAQVHKATMRDGKVVAVKVQHPYVKGNSLVDMKTMEILVKIVSWIFPAFKFQWLVDETKKNIPLELDFRKEAKNMEKVRQMFSHFPWLKIPRLYAELSTKRVLTMEYLDGGQVNDLEYIKANKINPFEVSDKLGQLYSQMIFMEGFVHSDPHPGNILVTRGASGKTSLVLLDHGLYATLSDDVRWEYSKLWLSILNKDHTLMKQHCDKLGIGEFYALFVCMVSGRTWDSVEAGINTTKFTVREKEMFQKEIPNFLPLISEILARVNRQMLLILKTNDLLRGIEYTLKTQSRMSSFLVMSRCCVRSVYGEQLRLCKTNFARWSTYTSQQWALFKLSVYYFYLSVCSILKDLPVGS